MDTSGVTVAQGALAGGIATMSGPEPAADSAEPVPALRRLQSPTRADWRLMLGLARGDSVLVVGNDAPELAQALRPWVQRVYSTLDNVGIDTDAGERTCTVSAAGEARGAPLAAGSLDWIIVEGALPDGGDVRTTLARLLPALKADGRVALNFDNLGPLGGWRRLRKDLGRGESVACRGLGHAAHLLTSAGYKELACYAVLPNRRAPRTLIPLEPPCPPAAEKFALGQAWKRAARGRAIGRLALRLLVDLRLLRHFYPHYLVVGRKEC
jgi:hypothetical protein